VGNDENIVTLRRHDSGVKGGIVGFDLLGGTRVEAAKKLAETLNEHVLDIS